MTRATIKPYKRERYYWARVPRINGIAEPRSLEVGDLSTAENICAFLVWARNKGEKYLLDEMCEGRIKPLLAYHAWLEHKLDEFIRTAKHGISDPDLFPHVAKWQTEMARIGTPREASRKKYLAQVTTLIDGPFLSSRLTKSGIREWLSDKGKSANRYRAALSSFCAYLVDTDVLAHNPVRDVKAARVSAPRERYLEQADVQRVLDALEGEARAYHALAACTALETQALVNLRRGDIDLTKRTVLARATKNAGRSRTCTVYKRWFWAWEIVTAYLDAHPMLPDASVFTIKADFAYRELRKACKAVGIADFRMHDWRHVWAVQAIRDGLTIQTVSHQLGHSNPSVTLNVYAKYVPTAADFERNSTPDHTVLKQATGGIGGN